METRRQGVSENGLPPCARFWHPFGCGRWHSWPVYHRSSPSADLRPLSGNPGQVAAERRTYSGWAAECHPIRTRKGSQTEVATAWRPAVKRQKKQRTPGGGARREGRSVQKDETQVAFILAANQLSQSMWIRSHLNTAHRVDPRCFPRAISRSVQAPLFGVRFFRHFGGVARAPPPAYL